MGSGIYGKARLEHVPDRIMIPHPRGFREETDILLAKCFRRQINSGFAPKAKKPAVQITGLGGIKTKFSAAESDRLPGGVVVDIDDVGPGAVIE